MEIRSGGINQRPCQPVGMGGLVAAFVKICSPFNPWPWQDHRTISFQQGQGNRVGNGPCNRFFDFRFNNPGQRMGNLYLVAVFLWEDDPAFSESGLKMKQQNTPTIYFKVEVARGHIRIRCKEEFNTTVLPNIVLMRNSNRPNIPVGYLKHHIYRHLVIGDLHLCPWEMIGFFPHMVLELLERDLFPRGPVPNGITHGKDYLSWYFAAHGLFSQLLSG